MSSSDESKKNMSGEVSNFPNPFNQSTTIRYRVPEDSRVKATIYNLQGQIVNNLLVNQFQTAGLKTIDWNSDSLPSGTYLCKIEGETFYAIRKTLLTR